MTDHPDAETLSAYFDGEAAEWEGHVSACPECRRGLEALESVRTAVAAPVPAADAARKDAAIAAAMSEAAGAPTQSTGRVPRWAALAGVAAVVLGAFVGVAVTRRGSQQKSTAAAKAASGPVASDVVDAGDLGDVSDDLALRQKLEPHMPQALAPSSASGAPTGPPAAASPSTPAQSSSVERSISATAGARKGSAKHSPAPCEGEARALQPGTEVLVYEATATWQGTPASVLGFSPPDSPATSARRPTRVYVLARSGCRLLSFQSYAP